MGDDDPRLLRRRLHGVSTPIAFIDCGLTSDGNHRHLHQLLAGFVKPHDQCALLSLHLTVPFIESLNGYALV
jgi:hypothetical protein